MFTHSHCIHITIIYDYKIIVINISNNLPAIMINSYKKVTLTKYGAVYKSARAVPDSSTSSINSEAKLLHHILFCTSVNFVLYMIHQIHLLKLTEFNNAY